MVHMIVAMNKTRTIGHQNTLPFHNREDLAHFKAKTLHHICVMGRVTYESIPGKLHHRRVWVLTHQKNYMPKHDNVVVFHDDQTLYRAIQSCTEDVFICGGLHIYRLFFPLVHILWLSHIDDAMDGDTKLDDFEQRLTLVQRVTFDTFVCEEYHR